MASVALNIRYPGSVRRPRCWSQGNGIRRRSRRWRRIICSSWCLRMTPKAYPGMNAIMEVLAEKVAVRSPAPHGTSLDRRRSLINR